MRFTINNSQIYKKQRDSNLELYRIIVMFLIVAHHYVVNSGLLDVIFEAPLTGVSATMLIFGAWGKTGINCFVLITGYFMCKSSFTWQKLLKLYLQITFYTVVIYGIFCITGRVAISPFILASNLFPVKSVTGGFTSCFMVFFLFIPFLNIFLDKLDKRHHRYLVILLLSVYTLLPTFLISVSFNYVTWFIAIYFLASYIRFYGFGQNISHKMWGYLTVLLVLVSSASVIGLFALYKYEYISFCQPYFFISDSNKLLALAVSVVSFMWFKDMKIPFSRVINNIGATTFGVLLIHANSDMMRQWLWKETVDCVGHFGDSVLLTLGYATVSVLIIFIICSGIDWFRGRLIGPALFNWANCLVLSIKRRFG